jgi:hypothetical protein
MKEVEKLLDEIENKYPIRPSARAVRDYKQLIIAMIKSVDNKIKANKDIGDFQCDYIEKTVSNTRIATLEELKTKLIDIIKRGNNE